MDYYNNPSSCGSSSGTGENRKEKMKKMSNGNGNGNGSSNGKRSKGVMKLSTDPQSVAARERRHRISDRFKILQSLVPGGTKMDTVSMLDEAIHYVKFLKTQIWLHQTMINFVDYDDPVASASASATATASSSLPFDHHNNNISNIFYPTTTNDDVNVVVDGVKMEEPFLPQFEPNYFPAGDEQFMCSYDTTYMNF